MHLPGDDRRDGFRKKSFHPPGGGSDTLHPSRAGERVVHNKNGSVATFDFKLTTGGRLGGIECRPHYESRADYKANRPATPTEDVARFAIQALAEFLATEQGQQLLSDCGATAGQAMADASTSLSNAYVMAADKGAALDAKRRELQAAAGEAYTAASGRAQRAADWVGDRSSDNRSFWRRHVSGE